MKLKHIRILFSTVFFLLFLLILYIPLNEKIIKTTNILLLTQIVPVILKLIWNFSLLVLLSFLIILIGTILFGRFYCSFLCPLGILQDILSYPRKLLKKYFKYKKDIPLLKNIIFFATILLAVANIYILLNLLDPYSIFTRINSEILKPFLSNFGNKIILFLSQQKIYLNFHFSYHKINLAFFIITLTTLFIIAILSLYNGRVYCTYICPVGTLLSYIGKVSIFKIKIDKNSCVDCKKCEKVCKSGCIDLKSQTIDNSRCVLCFNCLDQCKVNAISFAKYSNDTVSIKKRNFLLLLTFLPPILLRAKTKQNINTKFAKENIIMPPGSKSVENFTQKCVSCNLCVNSCPTTVLRTTFFEKNKGVLQPSLDFNYAYCEYECVNCAQVCPTDAISKISLNQKKETQIGVIELKKELCVSWAKDLDCGACAEHCPTKAVYMTPYKKIYAPETDKNICIGCGACEYVCPAKPKAIKIVGVTTQKIVKRIENKILNQTAPKKEKKVNEDFPF